MDREQLRAALREIELHTSIAENSAADARAVGRRLIRAMTDRKPAPEPVEPPVVEPEPSGHVSAVNNGQWLLVRLPDAARGSRAAEPPRSVTRTEETRWIPFIEHFRTEAGGVVETVCVLHNGNPQGQGAIRIPKLEIKAHDGRDIFDWQGPVTIEPGGMLVVRDYHFSGPGKITDYYDGGEPEPVAQMVFWGVMSNRLRGFDPEIGILLGAELDKQLANPVTVGPYDVMWGSRGDEVGGAGTEPDWFEWRRCPAGYALAAIEMYRVANRTSRCMTDADGAFTWDPETAYTTVIDAMPDAFKWTPQTATEQAMADYKTHDWEHLFRSYRAAMALARETKHPFALWYLRMFANFQQAAHLGTAGDELTDGWWSLQKKISVIDGPNHYCGRGEDHSARFAFEYERLFPMSRVARRLAEDHRQLFYKSLDANGVPFVMPTSAIVSKDAPAAWGDDPAFQTFEIQLAILMFEDSGDNVLERAAKKLAAYIGPHPPYCKNVKTGAGSGKANPYMNLATHGVGFASEADMWKVTKERVANGGPEAGGAVPANSFRPRRGIVS